MIVSCPTRLSYILTSREHRNIAQRCATAMMMLTTRFLFGAVHSVHISGWRAAPIWSPKALTACSAAPIWSNLFRHQRLSASIPACLLGENDDEDVKIFLTTIGISWKNTISDVGSTALYTNNTVYNVDTVYTVFTVYAVHTAFTVHSVYTVQTYYCYWKELMGFWAKFWVMDWMDGYPLDCFD